MRVSVLFNEPKLLKSTSACVRSAARSSFSALQRAENSSMRFVQAAIEALVGFSALQRAENSSTRPRSMRTVSSTSVSVLFSEPKIPQPRSFTPTRRKSQRVSVLFSEPKIPQLNPTSPRFASVIGFSALQRAENSSTIRQHQRSRAGHRVSVLFSEPKIPQPLRPSVQRA